MAVCWVGRGRHLLDTAPEMIFLGKQKKYCCKGPAPGKPIVLAAMALPSLLLAMRQEPQPCHSAWQQPFCLRAEVAIEANVAAIFQMGRSPAPLVAFWLGTKVLRQWDSPAASLLNLMLVSNPVSSANAIIMF